MNPETLKVEGIETIVICPSCVEWVAFFEAALKVPWETLRCPFCRNPLFAKEKEDEEECDGR